MRFLILTTSREALPSPQMAMPLIEAMRQWLSEQRDSGRIVVDFGFAGKPGGGAIVEFSSHEELDQAMAGFPFMQVSDVQVLPITDLDSALDSAQAAFEKMTEMMPAG